MRRRQGDEAEKPFEARYTPEDCANKLQPCYVLFPILTPTFTFLI